MNLKGKLHQSRWVFSSIKMKNSVIFVLTWSNFCWPGVTYMVSLPADQASKHPGHESMVKSIDQFACLQK